VSRQRLSDGAVAARLRDLPGWQLRDGKLHRAWSFGDFAEAWAFMTAVAHEAERLNHHPDWCNSYGRVTVDLVTHDAGGLTALDFELAARMSALAVRRAGGGG
jgi:4a-hydroxytetrahydrobiopterin dehydratase